MEYHIIQTEKADAQLRELILYIADDSGSAEVALNYLNKLEQGISLLRELPYCGAEVRYPALKKMKFRYLAIERHLIFYKVRECDKTVIVYAVVDHRQDYVNLIG